MLRRFVRSHLRNVLTKEKEITLEPTIPSLDTHFREFEELGIYLHIPFCEQICPYCPYNKEIYHPAVAARYAEAVKTEIDFYSELIGNKPVTSLYIGGGTPTTMLHNGLPDILEHMFRTFNVRCGIHLESHPNHLSAHNLGTIAALGVEHLSIGVESLQDRHLNTLKRPYTAKEAKAAVERAVNTDFKCVNTDMMFGFPDQTHDEVEEAGRTLADMAVNQVAAYPLFVFPYTQFGKRTRKQKFKSAAVFQRRKMLSILESIFYGDGFERTSAWAFTRTGVDKYCSVTVPLYVGLGASGGSYLKDVFYLNTFRVAEYINALEDGRMPIALSLALSEEMQMAGWLYWRIYETRFLKSDFKIRFGRDFDTVCGRYVEPMSLLGLLIADGDQIVLTDRGTFWLHAVEDLFSIDYIGKLWGRLMQNPWPQRVPL
jgi:oxygen-independent coproporphyrinogen-3 oxidase